MSKLDIKLSNIKHDLSSFYNQICIIDSNLSISCNLLNIDFITNDFQKNEEYITIHNYIDHVDPIINKNQITYFYNLIMYINTIDNYLFNNGSLLQPINPNKQYITEDYIFNNYEQSNLNILTNVLSNICTTLKSFHLFTNEYLRNHIIHIQTYLSNNQNILTNSNNYSIFTSYSKINQYDTFNIIHPNYIPNPFFTYEISNFNNIYSQIIDINNLIHTRDDIDNSLCNIESYLFNYGIESTSILSNIENDKSIFASYFKNSYVRLENIHTTFFKPILSNPYNNLQIKKLLYRPIQINNLHQYFTSIIADDLQFYIINLSNIDNSKDLNIPFISDGVELIRNRTFKIINNSFTIQPDFRDITIDINIVAVNKSESYKYDIYNDENYFSDKYIFRIVEQYFAPIYKIYPVSDYIIYPYTDYYIRNYLNSNVLFINSHINTNNIIEDTSNILSIYYEYDIDNDNIIFENMNMSNYYNNYYYTFDFKGSNNTPKNTIVSLILHDPFFKGFYKTITNVIIQEPSPILLKQNTQEYLIETGYNNFLIHFSNIFFNNVNTHRIIQYSITSNINVLPNKIYQTPLITHIDYNIIQINTDYRNTNYNFTISAVDLDYLDLPTYYTIYVEEIPPPIPIKTTDNIIFTNSNISEEIINLYDYFSSGTSNINLIFILESNNYPIDNYADLFHISNNMLHINLNTYFTTTRTLTKSIIAIDTLYHSSNNINIIFNQLPLIQIDVLESNITDIYQITTININDYYTFNKEIQFSITSNTIVPEPIGHNRSLINILNDHEFTINPDYRSNEYKLFITINSIEELYKDFDFIFVLNIKEKPLINPYIPLINNIEYVLSNNDIILDLDTIFVNTISVFDLHYYVKPVSNYYELIDNLITFKPYYRNKQYNLEIIASNFEYNIESIDILNINIIEQNAIQLLKDFSDITTFTILNLQEYFNENINFLVSTNSLLRSNIETLEPAFKLDYNSNLIIIPDYRNTTYLIELIAIHEIYNESKIIKYIKVVENIRPEIITIKNIDSINDRNNKFDLSEYFDIRYYIKYNIDLEYEITYRLNNNITNLLFNNEKLYFKDKIINTEFKFAYTDIQYDIYFKDNLDLYSNNQKINLNKIFIHNNLYKITFIPTNIGSIYTDTTFLFEIKNLINTFYSRTTNSNIEFNNLIDNITEFNINVFTDHKLNNNPLILSNIVYIETEISNLRHIPVFIELGNDNEYSYGILTNSNLYSNNIIELIDNNLKINPYYRNTEYLIFIDVYNTTYNYISNQLLYKITELPVFEINNNIVNTFTLTSNILILPFNYFIKNNAIECNIVLNINSYGIRNTRDNRPFYSNFDNILYINGDFRNNEYDLKLTFNSIDIDTSIADNYIVEIPIKIIEEKIGSIIYNDLLIDFNILNNENIQEFNLTDYFNYKYLNYLEFNLIYPTFVNKDTIIDNQKLKLKFDYNNTNYEIIINATDYFYLPNENNIQLKLNINEQKTIQDISGNNYNQYINIFNTDISINMKNIFENITHFDNQEFLISLSNNKYENSNLYFQQINNSNLIITPHGKGEEYYIIINSFITSYEDQSLTKEIKIIELPIISEKVDLLTNINPLYFSNVYDTMTCNYPFYNLLEINSNITKINKYINNKVYIPEIIEYNINNNIKNIGLIDVFYEYLEDTRDIEYIINFNVNINESVNSNFNLKIKEEPPIDYIYNNHYRVEKYNDRINIKNQFKNNTTSNIEIIFNGAYEITNNTTNYISKYLISNYYLDQPINIIQSNIIFGFWNHNNLNLNLHINQSISSNITFNNYNWFYTLIVYIPNSIILYSNMDIISNIPIEISKINEYEIEFIDTNSISKVSVFSNMDFRTHNALVNNIDNDLQFNAKNPFRYGKETTLAYDYNNITSELDIIIANSGKEYELLFDVYVKDYEKYKKLEYSVFVIENDFRIVENGLKSDEIYQQTMRIKNENIVDIELFRINLIKRLVIQKFIKDTTIDTILLENSLLKSIIIDRDNDEIVITINPDISQKITPNEYLADLQGILSADNFLLDNKIFVSQYVVINNLDYTKLTLEDKAFIIMKVKELIKNAVITISGNKEKIIISILLDIDYKDQLEFSSNIKDHIINEKLKNKPTVSLIDISEPVNIIDTILTLDMTPILYNKDDELLLKEIIKEELKDNELVEIKINESKYLNITISIKSDQEYNNNDNLYENIREKYFANKSKLIKIPSSDELIINLKIVFENSKYVLKGFDSFNYNYDIRYIIKGSIIILDITEIDINFEIDAHNVSNQNKIITWNTIHDTLGLYNIVSETISFSLYLTTNIIEQLKIVKEVDISLENIDFNGLSDNDKLILKTEIKKYDYVRDIIFINSYPTVILKVIYETHTEIELPNVSNIINNFLTIKQQIYETNIEITSQIINNKVEATITVLHVDKTNLVNVIKDQILRKTNEIVEIIEIDDNCRILIDPKISLIEDIHDIILNHPTLKSNILEIVKENEKSFYLDSSKPIIGTISDYININNKIVSNTLITLPYINIINDNVINIIKEDYKLIEEKNITIEIINNNILLSIRSSEPNNIIETDFELKIINNELMSNNIIDNYITNDLDIIPNIIEKQQITYRYLISNNIKLLENIKTKINGDENDITVIINGNELIIKLSDINEPNLFNIILTELDNNLITFISENKDLISISNYISEPIEIKTDLQEDIIEFNSKIQHVVYNEMDESDLLIFKEDIRRTLTEELGYELLLDDIEFESGSIKILVKLRGELLGIIDNFDKIKVTEIILQHFKNNENLANKLEPGKILEDIELIIEKFEIVNKRNDDEIHIRIEVNEELKNEIYNKITTNIKESIDSAYVIKGIEELNILNIIIRSTKGIYGIAAIENLLKSGILGIDNFTIVENSIDISGTESILIEKEIEYVKEIGNIDLINFSNILKISDYTEQTNLNYEIITGNEFIASITNDEIILLNNGNNESHYIEVNGIKENLKIEFKFTIIETNEVGINIIDSNINIYPLVYEKKYFILDLYNYYRKEYINYYICNLDILLHDHVILNNNELLIIPKNDINQYSFNIKAEDTFKNFINEDLTFNVKNVYAIDDNKIIGESNITIDITDNEVVIDYLDFYRVNKADSNIIFAQYLIENSDNILEHFKDNVIIDNKLKINPFYLRNTYSIRILVIYKDLYSDELINKYNSNVIVNVNETGVLSFVGMEEYEKIYYPRIDLTDNIISCNLFENIILHYNSLNLPNITICNINPPILRNAYYKDDINSNAYILSNNIITFSGEYRNVDYNIIIDTYYEEYDHIKLRHIFNIHESKIPEIEVIGSTNYIYNDQSDQIIYLSNIKSLYNYIYNTELIIEYIFNPYNPYECNLLDDTLRIDMNYRGSSYTVNLIVKDNNFNLSNNEIILNISEIDPFIITKNNIVYSNIKNNSIIVSLNEFYDINIPIETENIINFYDLNTISVTGNYELDNKNRYIFDYRTILTISNLSLNEIIYLEEYELEKNNIINFSEIENVYSNNDYFVWNTKNVKIDVDYHIGNNIIKFKDIKYNIIKTINYDKNIRDVYNENTINSNLIVHVSDNKFIYNGDHRNSNIDIEVILSNIYYPNQSKILNFKFEEDVIPDIIINDKDISYVLSTRDVIIYNMYDVYSNYIEFDKLIFTSLNNFVEFDNCNIIIKPNFRDINYIIDIIATDNYFNKINSEFDINIVEYPPLEFKNKQKELNILIDNLSNTSVIYNVFNEIEIYANDCNLIFSNSHLINCSKTEYGYYNGLKLFVDPEYHANDFNIYINPEYRNKTYEIWYNIYMSGYEDQYIQLRLKINEINIPDIISLSGDINKTFDSNISLENNLHELYDYPYLDKLRFNIISNDKYNYNNNNILTFTPNFRNINYIVNLEVYDPYFTIIKKQNNKNTEINFNIIEKPPLEFNSINNYEFIYNLYGNRFYTDYYFDKGYDRIGLIEYRDPTLTIYKNDIITFRNFAYVSKLLLRYENSFIMREENNILRYKFTKSGTYFYYSDYGYSRMIGKIIVLDIPNYSSIFSKIEKFENLGREVNIINVKDDITIYASHCNIIIEDKSEIDHIRKAFYNIEYPNAVTIENNSNLILVSEHRNVDYVCYFDVYMEGYDNNKLSKIYEINEAKIPSIINNNVGYTVSENETKEFILKNYYTYPYNDKLVFSIISAKQGLKCYNMFDDDIDEDINYGINNNFKFFIDLVINEKEFEFIFKAEDLKFNIANFKLNITIIKDLPIAFNFENCMSGIHVSEHIYNMSNEIIHIDLLNKYVSNIDPGNILVVEPFNTIINGRKAFYPNENIYNEELPFKIINSDIYLIPEYRNTIYKNEFKLYASNIECNLSYNEYYLKVEFICYEMEISDIIYNEENNLELVGTINFDNINEVIYNLENYYTYTYLKYLNFTYFLNENNIPYNNTIIEQSNLNIIIKPKYRGKLYTVNIDAYDSNFGINNINLNFKINEIPAIRFVDELEYPDTINLIKNIDINNLAITQIICNLEDYFINNSDTDVIYTNSFDNVRDAFYNNTMNKKALIRYNTTILDENLLYITTNNIENYNGKSSYKVVENLIKDISFVDNKEFGVILRIYYIGDNVELFNIKGLNNVNEIKTLFRCKSYNNNIIFETDEIESVIYNLNLNEWYNIVFNCYSNKRELYINNVLVNDVNNTNGIINNYNNIELVINKNILYFQSFIISDKPLIYPYDIEYFYNNETNLIFYKNTKLYINPEFRNISYTALINIKMKGYEEISRTLKFNINEIEILPIILKNNLETTFSNLSNNEINIQNLQNYYDYYFSDKLKFNFTHSILTRNNVELNNSNLKVITKPLDETYYIRIFAYDPKFTYSLEYNLELNAISVNAVNNLLVFEFIELPAIILTEFPEENEIEILVNTEGNVQYFIDINNYITNYTEHSNYIFNTDTVLPRKAYYLKDIRSNVINFDNSYELQNVETSNNIITINPDFRNIEYNIDVDILMSNYPRNKVTLLLNIIETKIPNIILDSYIDLFYITSNFPLILNNLTDQYNYVYSNELILTCNIIENGTDIGYDVNIFNNILTVKPDLRDNNYDIRIIAYDKNFTCNLEYGLQNNISSNLVNNELIINITELFTIRLKNNNYYRFDINDHPYVSAYTIDQNYLLNNIFDVGTEDCNIILEVKESSSFKRYTILDDENNNVIKGTKIHIIFDYDYYYNCNIDIIAYLQNYENVIVNTTIQIIIPEMSIPELQSDNKYYNLILDELIDPITHRIEFDNIFRNRLPVENLTISIENVEDTSVFNFYDNTLYTYIKPSKNFYNQNDIILPERLLEDSIEFINFNKNCNEIGPYYQIENGFYHVIYVFKYNSEGYTIKFDKKYDTSNLELLIVGGGAGGRTGDSILGGAGGNGGDVIYWNMPINKDRIYSIEVGNGGESDTSGGNSLFTDSVFSITANGGMIGNYNLIPIENVFYNTNSFNTELEFKNEGFGYVNIEELIVMSNNPTVVFNRREYARGAGYYIGDDFSIGSAISLNIFNNTNISDTNNGKLYLGGGGLYGYYGNIELEHVVYCSGENTYYMLGLSDNSRRYELTEISTLNGLNIVHANIGEYHSLFLSKDGLVYGCGYNNYNQIGRESTFNNYVVLPQQITEFKDYEGNLISLPTIVKIYAGYEVSLFLDSNGYVYGCGKKKSGLLGLGPEYQGFNKIERPTRTNLLQNIVDICISEFMSLFLDNQGTVYSSGTNSTTYTRSSSITSSSYPSAITEFRDNSNNAIQTPNIISIILGGDDHGFLLGSNKRVYAFGNNTTYGKLGVSASTSSITNKYIPTEISVFLNGTTETLPNIIAVNAGYEHSLFLDENGNVYSCGQNSHTQLGLSHNTITPQPTLITRFENEEGLVITPKPKIVAISAVRNSSLFLDENGNMYVCGSNQYGTLGMGTTTNYSVPTLNTKVDSITVINATKNLTNSIMVIKSYIRAPTTPSLGGGGGGLEFGSLPGKELSGGGGSGGAIGGYEGGKGGSGIVLLKYNTGLKYYYDDDYYCNINSEIYKEIKVSGGNVFGVKENQIVRFIKVDFIDNLVIKDLVDPTNIIYLNNLNTVCNIGNDFEIIYSNIDIGNIVKNDEYLSIINDDRGIYYDIIINLSNFNFVYRIKESGDIPLPILVNSNYPYFYSIDDKYLDPITHKIEFTNIFTNNYPILNKYLPITLTSTDSSFTTENDLIYSYIRPTEKYYKQYNTIKIQDNNTNLNEINNIDLALYNSTCNEIGPYYFSDSANEYNIVYIFKYDELTNTDSSNTTYSITFDKDHTNVDLLIVGGGGGGGSGTTTIPGNGGYGGEVIYSNITINNNITYKVEVGNGIYNSEGNRGYSSIFNTIEALGGNNAQLPVSNTTISGININSYNNPYVTIENIDTDKLIIFRYNPNDTNSSGQTEYTLNYNKIMENTQCLIVGGGGGGGALYRYRSWSGGGGGGSVIKGIFNNVNTYTILVGKGGTGGVKNIHKYSGKGNNGVNSKIVFNQNTNFNWLPINSNNTVRSIEAHGGGGGSGMSSDPQSTEVNNHKWTNSSLVRGNSAPIVGGGVAYNYSPSLLNGYYLNRTTQISGYTYNPIGIQTHGGAKNSFHAGYSSMYYNQKIYESGTYYGLGGASSQFTNTELFGYGGAYRHIDTSFDSFDGYNGNHGCVIIRYRYSDSIKHIEPLIGKHLTQDNIPIYNIFKINNLGDYLNLNVYLGGGGAIGYLDNNIAPLGGGGDSVENGSSPGDIGTGGGGSGGAIGNHPGGKGGSGLVVLKYNTGYKYYPDEYYCNIEPTIFYKSLSITATTIYGSKTENLHFIRTTHQDLTIPGLDITIPTIEFANPTDEFNIENNYTIVYDPLETSSSDGTKIIVKNNNQGLNYHLIVKDENYYYIYNITESG